MRETSVESLTVRIDELAVECHIGVPEEERAKPQRLLLTLALAVTPPADLGPDFSDDIHAVIDYGALRLMARETCRANHFKLLESLADLIARRCLEDPRVTTAEVTLVKPDIFEDCKAAGVTVTRRAASA